MTQNHLIVILCYVAEAVKGKSASQHKTGNTVNAKKLKELYSDYQKVLATLISITENGKQLKKLSDQTVQLVKKLKIVLPSVIDDYPTILTTYSLKNFLNKQSKFFDNHVIYLKSPARLKEALEEFKGQSTRKLSDDKIMKELHKQMKPDVEASEELAKTFREMLMIDDVRTS